MLSVSNIIRLFSIIDRTIRNFNQNHAFYIAKNAVYSYYMKEPERKVKSSWKLTKNGDI